MSLVERLRMPPFQELEAAGQVRLGALEDEVEVRRHEAERVDRPPIPLHAPGHEAEKVATILVVTEDRAAVDASREHVEEAVWE